MPIEYLPNLVVLLAKSPSGFNQDGQAILSQPQQVRARWVQKAQEVIMVTNQLVAKGSQAWFGSIDDYNTSLANLPPGQQLDMWVVITNSFSPDVKGRNPYYSADLIPFSSSGQT